MSKKFFLKRPAALGTVQPTYGPQVGVVQPGGSITIPAGSTSAAIQTIINAHGAGTTYWFPAATYPVNSPITPKTGDTYLGEYGSILDGSGWVSTDTSMGGFRASLQAIHNVTIQNLVIQHMPQKGIYASSSSATPVGSAPAADSWLVTYCELGYNLVGIVLANFGTLSHSYLHHNSGDPHSGDFDLQGGMYQAYLATDITYDTNHWAFNGVNSKVSLCPNCTFRNNWFEHNLENAIWWDGENPGFLAENNVIEDNAAAGIVAEVCGTGIIRNNTIRRNGDQAIFISTTRDTEIYNNQIENNFRGILYFVDCTRVGQGGEIGIIFDLVNVSSHDNTIIVDTTPGVLTNGGSFAACTAGQSAPYWDGTKNLTFTHNAYQVPLPVTGNYWIWADIQRTWAQWQAIPQDATGTVTGP